MDNRRNVGRPKDFDHSDAMSSCIDKLSSGSIAVDEETNGIVVVCQGGHLSGLTSLECEKGGFSNEL